ncbi:3-hydroxyisobutyrate dehydrogenase [Chitinophaga sp. CF118]|nr:3-hydroxyisobutyrate dehydrogenase [Chitinophaga sp. CF118]
MTTTREVSVIGLGSMGAVLAHTLVRNGYRVTVWNRTRAKAEPLIKEGAAFTPDIVTAINASPVIIICVTDYQVTRNILEPENVASSLAGRTLVQLSTGTPKDARDAEAWIRGIGADYLDGAILATPSQMGMPDTPIFLSGSGTAYQKSEQILKVLGGNLMYMGEAVGSASAWDIAALSSLFGLMIGFFHGARVIEEEGLRVDALGSMIAGIAPVLGQMVKNTSDDIQKEDYSEPQSTLEICALSFELMIRQSREAGINAEIPEFALKLFSKALNAGYGNERLGALIKTLRAGS